MDWIFAYYYTEAEKYTIATCRQKQCRKRPKSFLNWIKAPFNSQQTGHQGGNTDSTIWCLLQSAKEIKFITDDNIGWSKTFDFIGHQHERQFLQMDKHNLDRLPSAMHPVLFSSQSINISTVLVTLNSQNVPNPQSCLKEPHGNVSRTCYCMEKCGEALIFLLAARFRFTSVVSHI